MAEAGLGARRARFALDRVLARDPEGGWVVLRDAGRWTGRDVPAPLAALLRTAEVVHVGKGATFGLGKVEVS